MYTFITPQPVTLEIRNSAGDIAIELTDTTTTTVEITAGSSHPLGFVDEIFRAWGGRGRDFSRFGEQAGSDPVDRTESVLVDYRERDEGGTVIVDTDPARDAWRSAFTIRITAPAASHIRVQANSSGVSVTGPTDRIEARTASGDVRLAEVFGKALVHTASGDIRIARAGSDVDIRTASGNIDLGPIAGDALIHTTSGDIKLGAIGGGLNARSVSGDVRVADAVSGHTEISAVTGDVEIGIHAGSRASVVLSTLTGSTDTDFEISEQAPEGDAPSLEIQVKTTSGDIRLRRAA